MSELITVQNDFITVKISTLGAEIHSVCDKNKNEFMWDGDPNVWAMHAPIMFPICGGLKEDNFIADNGQKYTLNKHGFAKYSEFTLASSSSESAKFVLKASDETLKKYPYDFEFTVEYTLDENKIKSSYIIKNNGNENMYFSVGHHEAYATPEGIEEYDIIFDKEESLKANIIEGNLLLSEKNNITENSKVLTLDDKYFEIDALAIEKLNSRSVILKHRNGKRTVKVDFDGFDHLMIWHVHKSKYICIEPWSGLPDFKGSSYEIKDKAYISTLGAGEECVFNHSFAVSI